MDARRIIKQLGKGISSSLPQEKSQLFEKEFKDLFPKTTNYNQICAAFMAWLLEDKTNGVIRFVKEGSSEEIAIHRIARLYQEECTVQAVWETAAQIVYEAAASSVVHLAIRAAASAANQAANAAIAAVAAGTAVEEAAMAAATIQAKIQPPEPEESETALFSVSNMFQQAKIDYYSIAAEKLLGLLKEQLIHVPPPIPTS